MRQLIRRLILLQYDNLIERLKYMITVQVILLERLEMMKLQSMIDLKNFKSILK